MKAVFDDVFDDRQQQTERFTANMDVSVMFLQRNWTSLKMFKGNWIE